MTLKTLKDLKLNWRIEDPIKEEGKKWLKHYNNETDFKEYRSVIWFIKNFFNLGDDENAD